MILRRADIVIDGRDAVYETHAEGLPTLTISVPDYAAAEGIAAVLERSAARKRGAKDPSPGPVAKSESPSGNGGGVRAEEALKCIVLGCDEPATKDDFCAKDYIGGVSPEVRAALRAKKEAAHV